MLKKRYIRDGRNRLIGSLTTGYSDTSSIVRDERDQILGLSLIHIWQPGHR